MAAVLLADTLRSLPAGYPALAYQAAAAAERAASRVRWPAEFDAAVQQHWQAGLGWTE